MRHKHLDTDCPDFDPPLAVATPEEIAIAERLRRLLERKYFGSSAEDAGAAIPSDTLEWDEPID